MEVMIIWYRDLICDVVHVKDREACRHYLMGLCITRAHHMEVADLSLEELASWITEAHFTVTGYEVRIMPVTEL